MSYYEVTYNPIGVRKYIVVQKAVVADSKWHAIEIVYSKYGAVYPVRAKYKAKLLKT